MNLDRIVIFALFWMAVGMLLMIFMKYQIIGMLISLSIFIFCFFWKNRCG